MIDTSHTTLQVHASQWCIVTAYNVCEVDIVQCDDVLLLTRMQLLLTARGVSTN